jgi:hypothetical protein
MAREWIRQKRRDRMTSAIQRAAGERTAREERAV